MRKLGQPPTNSLADWLEQLSPKFKAKLAEFGLLDARSLCQSEPLAAHLDEFHAMMLAKGGTREHADTLKARIRNTLAGCRFVFFGDIKPSTVLRYLAKLREPIKQGDTLKPGLSIQTSNFYLKSFQQFCRWMVDDRRANENPVSGLKGGNVKLDRRHDRRGLSPDELGRLLTTTSTRPVLRKLSGRARVMLYRVAMETGLRRKELRSLTPAAFDFDSPEPTVFVSAGNSKNRRETVQPIRRELVEELRQWFVEAGFQPDQLLWPKLTNDTATMLEADLAAAGIAYVDDAGLFADFHALRHSFVSMLAAGNVHPKLAQKLARHSDINLTMSRYSHTLRSDESNALTSLPQFPSMFDSPRTESATLRSTGTDDVRSNDLQAGLQEKATFQPISVPLGACSEGLNDDHSTPTKKPRNSRENREFGAVIQAEREGI